MISFIRSLFESTFKTNPNIVFAVLTGCLRISKESIFTGMNSFEVVSILKHEYDERERKSYLTLKIPNVEVDYIFREKVSYWFEEKVKERDRSRLYQAVIEKDAAVFEEELNDIMPETISFMGYHESYYHGLVTGVLTAIKRYITKSNREGGTGRSDLFIKPVSRRKEAFVFEFKVAKSIPEMEKKAEEAIRQIEEKQYAGELFDEGYGRVSMYGIAFFGKECAVRLKE